MSKIVSKEGKFIFIGNDNVETELKVSERADGHNLFILPKNDEGAKTVRVATVEDALTEGEEFVIKVAVERKARIDYRENLSAEDKVIYDELVAKAEANYAANKPKKSKDVLSTLSVEEKAALIAKWQEELGL